MSTYGMRNNIIFFMEFFILFMIIIILVFLLACFVIMLKKFFLLSEFKQKESINNEDRGSGGKQAKKRKHNAAINETDNNDFEENNQVLPDQQEDINYDFPELEVETDNKMEYYSSDRLDFIEQEGNGYCYSQEDSYHKTHKNRRIGLENPGMPKTIDKAQKLITREDGELIIIEEDSQFYYVFPYDTFITEKYYDGTAIKECFKISQNIQGGKQYEIVEGEKCIIRREDLSIVERGHLTIRAKTFYEEDKVSFPHSKL